ncbi:bifunctional tRNA (5-methylaminomethyl-2-thiouridine)(34)-methyltransferase MnmD/FAD-dependent 5-carboxymethylaminomethyl-2-thiouridine(34) oxidoreductase MnmC [Azomonas macrocytogenes]|uniref:tRNA 5-methylaminomethyl-2-thiouridine biosynthesis bifunctional protein MnmC n=1 Tax=Azomonas macrocytogenes TaxID=69962 RepID=A0A839T828_AZOMA|nr:bifunctional tRNA (5-methylaminomethyl-2-thiouridine)(34)-methyltransferase MnmD/FAD-dependent 5-carboxymethylaminomethyl-2-thiouridine(34) oxidoreductase MnmC [Azomonas macrocytogenes]MBB3104115.1 tRNA 5-methylaminomethyl-2-thiouridine biosynthesis bifunctional protein [Azomonas macrocytogenes]
MIDIHAQLDWDAQGQPLSRQFGDVYFSRDDGLGETRHVFLVGNDLGKRFAALAAGECLTIGETGFGTGMNFFCAWQLFEQTAPDTARLHFVSVEKYPLAPGDLHRALALWPELAPWSGQLLEQYVALHPGFQRLVFANGRVLLTLLVGDALELLPQLDARIDAWFLDGFAPAKNPQMWTPELFGEVARLSAPGATLGTFTSAGFVRRGLIDAGFEMQRVPGYGRKREILRGQFIGKPSTTDSPWYAHPGFRPGKREAVVIGAGLAGCATAASLAARGWQVRLLERHGEVAQEGSGNPQGVLYLKLSAHGTALSQLVVSGFGHTRRLLRHLPEGQDWSACGVLQVAFDAREAKRQQQLAKAFTPTLLHVLEQQQAEHLAGIALPAGGLFFPEAGWLHPPALCRWLATRPGIELLRHHQALELQRNADGWQVLNGGTLLAEAPVVVLAGAGDTLTFAQSAWLPLKRIRGQISRLPATATSRTLATVVCAQGYVAPARGDEHTLGASFAFHAENLEPSATEHGDNLDMLAAISSDLYQRFDAGQLQPDELAGRAAFRCTSPDYLPLVGPLADAAAFATIYAPLRKDARLRPDSPCPWLDGLYVNTGHGSRGLISAPLAGELLAAWLENEPLPVPRSVAEACHPNRFLLRRIIRGNDRQGQSSANA